MKFLDNIAAQLAVFAAAAVSAAKDAGKDFLDQVADAADDGFEALVSQLGAKATEIVTNLFADENLSGLEKANLAATQLVEHATLNGIEAASEHITSLIHSAYLAVKAEIATL